MNDLLPKISFNCSLNLSLIRRDGEKGDECRMEIVEEDERGCVREEEVELRMRTGGSICFKSW